MTINPAACLIKQALDASEGAERIPDAVAEAIRAHCGDLTVYLAQASFTNSILPKEIATSVGTDHASTDPSLCLTLLGDEMIHAHQSGGIAGWRIKEVALERCQNAVPAAGTTLEVHEEHGPYMSHPTRLAWQIRAGTAEDVVKAVNDRLYGRREHGRKQLYEARMKALGESTLP